jgi:hypothetical protein
MVTPTVKNVLAHVSQQDRNDLKQMSAALVSSHNGKKS